MTAAADVSLAAAAGAHARDRVAGQVGRFPDHLPDQIMPPPPPRARARTQPRRRAGRGRGRALSNAVRIKLAFNTFEFARSSSSFRRKKLV